MAVAEPNAVMEHLVVQKALADHDPDRINSYMEMAEADVTRFQDPFDQAIALSFKLVLDEDLDPWSIDLVRFSKLYTDRVRETREVDLITAGRLVAMAWTILRRQSEELVVRATPPVEEEPVWDIPWDELPDPTDADDVDTVYTHRVVTAPRAPISETIFHQGDRRVTLIELVEALETAKAEAEVRIRLADERRKAREAARKDSDSNVRKKVHKEDLEAEIHDVRERLLMVPGEVPISQVHDGTRDDFLTVFVSSLFLSRAEMVDLRQEAFPTSEVLLEPLPRLHDESATLIGLPTKPEDARKRSTKKNAAKSNAANDDPEVNDDRGATGSDGDAVAGPATNA